MLRRSGAMVLHSVRLAGLYVHLVRMRLAIGDGWWFIECALKLLCSGVDRRERRRSVGAATSCSHPHYAAPHPPFSIPQLTADTPWRSLRRVDAPPLAWAMERLRNGHDVRDASDVATLAACATCATSPARHRLDQACPCHRLAGVACAASPGRRRLRGIARRLHGVASPSSRLLRR